MGLPLRGGPALPNLSTGRDWPGHEPVPMQTGTEARCLLRCPTLVASGRLSFQKDPPLRPVLPHRQFSPQKKGFVQQKCFWLRLDDDLRQRSLVDCGSPPLVRRSFKIGTAVVTMLCVQSILGFSFRESRSRPLQDSLQCGHCFQFFL